MSYEDGVRIALVLVVVLASGIVKGAIGFGAPLVTVPLIANILDARSAVIISSLTALFGNVGMALMGGGSRTTFKRLAPILGGMVVGTVFGALFVASVSPSSLGVFVGACTLTFGLVSSAKPSMSLSPTLERYLSAPMGLFGGMLGGSTSIFSPIIASYLYAMNLHKREFVFFVALLYVVGGLVQVASYARLGLYDAGLLVIILLSCIPNGLGLVLGIRLQGRIDQLVFRRIVVAVILVSGVNLIVTNLWRQAS